MNHGAIYIRHDELARLYLFVCALDKIFSDRVWRSW